MTNVDGNYFVSGWGGEHDLKFGFGYKHAPASSSSVYGGRDTQLLAWNFGPGASTVWVGREGFVRYEGDFFHAYVGDTFTKGRLTATAGLRFDRQVARNEPATVQASPTFPELLPAVEYAGGGVGATWADVSPRASLSVALDEARRTVARASFARYAGKLSTGTVLTENPVGFSYLAYLWDDVNGDGLPQAAEVDLDSGVQYHWNVDPANPTALNTTDTIDADYSAPIDYEIVVGVDHELLPELALSAAYTWRRSTNVAGWGPRIGLTSADYTANDPVTANGFTAQTYSPDPAAILGNGGGFIQTNRPDYHRGYDGLELSLVKRLSKGWMLRTAFSWMDWREYLDGPGAIQSPGRTANEPLVDGGPNVPTSGGGG